MLNSNGSMQHAQFVERSKCISCGSTSLSVLSTGLFDDAPLHDFLSADPWGEDPIPFLLGNRWSFVQCNHCNQAFHKYILAPDWNERRFSQWMTQEAIDSFERSLNTPERLFNKGVQNTKHVLQLEKLTRELRGTTPLRLLDFGCGYGEFIEMCSLYGFDAYGIDRSSARRNNATFERIFQDLESLDRHDFHVITMFEVLEHLDDPKSLLEALKGYLIKGGVLVIETPDCTGVNSITTLSEYRKIHPLEHINAFTAETMRNLAESLGFESIKKPTSHVTTDPIRVIKTEVKRMLGSVLRTNTQQYFKKL
ncbi:MAG: class I SAM-dependent methyltransferase [Gammaproteobacteria bacterium]|nr:class I SAM-dependent methyltransferase [Gammaproteobacteria bacterium]MBU1483045.1 class I SAM-dependent methyltransferase [Gammaproteobacteria bacterium]